MQDLMLRFQRSAEDFAFGRFNSKKELIFGVWRVDWSGEK